MFFFFQFDDNRISRAWIQQSEAIFVRSIRRPMRYDFEFDPAAHVLWCSIQMRVPVLTSEELSWLMTRRSIGQLVISSKCCDSRKKKKSTNGQVSANGRADDQRRKLQMTDDSQQASHRRTNKSARIRKTLPQDNEADKFAEAPDLTFGACQCQPGRADKISTKTASKKISTTLWTPSVNISR